MNMLNPYTLKPEPQRYRPDSTMAIAIQKEEFRKLKEREARKEAFFNFFRRSNKK